MRNVSKYTREYVGKNKIEFEQEHCPRVLEHVMIATYLQPDMLKDW